MDLCETRTSAINMFATIKMIRLSFQNNLAEVRSLQKHLMRDDVLVNVRYIHLLFTYSCLFDLFLKIVCLAWEIF